MGEYYRPFTIPGHIICRLCEAKGKSECEILHGYESVSIESAHNFAFDRFQKSVLVDSSKRLDWLAKFVGKADYQIKAIHLLRDPRAWYCSEKRRFAEMDPRSGMEQWIATNQEISTSLKNLQLPFVTAFYDELCLNPHEYFASTLSDYLEMPFEPAALEYWNKEHHGLGGNGAALNNLKKYSDAQVLTAGNRFYEQNLGKHFYDSRWHNELPAEDRISIESNKAVEDYLYQFSRSLGHFDQLVASCSIPD